MGSRQNLKGSLRLGNYLKRLRTGYGYSLRRVEERARAEGGEIDNSQLSRYEKGICYPSFDKLRVLASVFNVSVQHFSDIVDLEDFEELKPEAADPALMIEEGGAALKAGDTGRAFACFERALEQLLDAPDEQIDHELAAKARISQAAALTRLGKLALAEQELRSALRHPKSLGPEMQARALLALAVIHADQGDLIMAELEAERTMGYAQAAGRTDLEARALHTVGRVLAERGEYEEAIGRYRQAVTRYAECGDRHQEIRLKIQIGGCYVEMGKHREGIRILSGALNEARSAGHRRLESQAWAYLGLAYFHQQDHVKARSCFRESDARANFNHERHPDILFHNAFYDWQIARSAANPTREKIAFGRLKALRASLERRMREIDAFDAYVERGRRDA